MKKKVTALASLVLLLALAFSMFTGLNKNEYSTTEPGICPNPHDNIFKICDGGFGF